MLTGREHFYADWLQRVREVAAQSPVLDLGTSKPFRKEMSAIKDAVTGAYFCLDYNYSADISLIADGERLPVRSDSVGAVLCSHVLEHVKRPGVVIQETYRVLRRGGRGYFTLLDVYPYHASPGLYPDLHRFTVDAVQMYFEAWNEVSFVQGGPVQALMNFLPSPINRSRLIQGVANRVDHRHPKVAPMRYVYAVK